MPSAESAIIDNDKIVKYLLNPSHPDGIYKALYFIKKGLNEISLYQTLQQHALNKITKKEVSIFGTKYIIEARTKGQNSFLMRSVWIIYKNETTPKLITAYPIKL